MGKRGPQPSGLVELTTTVTPELDRALAQMVAVSGLSKSTVVRTALAEHLAAVGLLPPMDTVRLVQMPAPKRKEKNA